MDTTFADEYKSSLNDLNFNSKPLINMLTMLADENKKHASVIVNTIVDHIISTSLESKLPGLYLVDSIIKNLGDQYLKIFCLHIVRLFTSVFEKVDENTRSLMFKLRQTWKDILPNKVLYNLDLGVEELDPAWPVTAKNPSKKILINPKFLGGPTEEPKADAVAPVSNVPTTTIKNEEDKLKQRQGEVLKQLLAKQEQLRQLELKKLQLTMKKKSSVMGSTSFNPSTSSNIFKQNPVWDPRMVKINNVPQHPPEIKAEASSLPQGKLEPGHVIATASNALPDSKKAVPQIKSQSKFNSTYSKNNLSAQKNNHESRTMTDLTPASTSPKKLGQKNKNDKSYNSKGKFSPVKNDKSHVDLKPTSKESSIKSPKKESHTNKDESKGSKPREKSSRSNAKPFKASPKKKTAFENSNKMFHSQNISHAQTEPVKLEHKRKPPLQRIPKKSDRLKSTNVDLATNVHNEVNTENKQLNDSSSISVDKDNKDVTSVLPPNQPESSSMVVDQTSQSVETQISSSKTSESLNELEEKVKSTKIDINSISKKDEDLRILPLPSKEETTIKVPKPDHDFSEQSSDKDKRSDSRKKQKTEDIENLNPEYRKTLSPLLFGSQDQDLRHSDPNLKDWSSYKATHPDEYSPSPRHENFEGRFRFRKHQFSDSKYYYPRDQDRYGPMRHPRGRFFSRRSRAQFMRGGRNRLFHPTPDASFMLDSLLLAEEKFRSGKISEAAFMDIRDDLRKAMQSIIHNRSKAHYSNFQDQDHHDHAFDQQEVIRPDFNSKQNVPADNIKIQNALAVPPDKKPFFLDGKERVIHFVEDKALVILDNNEPRELTFRDEQRTIFIEGIAEPLILSFDGKSVEFAVDGKRHILRLGIPGREIYINNHPYEAHFGGPPIAVMLEDGCIYKMGLSGPPPQVIIGSTPQHELFSKYHGNLKEEPFIQGPSCNEDQKCTAEHSTPSSGAFLQDVDMRLKPKNIDQSEALVNKESPFYIQDMKDVDWRQVPPSNVSNPEKNAPDDFKEDISKNFETWPKEDRENQITFTSIRNDQDLVSESTHYEWKKSPSYHQPTVQGENTDPAACSSQDNWYNNQQAKLQWRNNEYKQDSHPLPPGKRPRYEDSRDVKQNEYYEPYESRNNQFQTYMPHNRRQAYPRMRGRGINDKGRGSWVPNIERGPNRLDPLRSKPASKNFPTQPSRPRALLPSPPYPPEFPKVNHSHALPSKDVIVGRLETNDESSSGFLYEPVASNPEVKSTEPTKPDLNVDVNSLLAKLVAAGIINNKPFEIPVVESSEALVTLETPDSDTDKKDEDSPVEEIPKIEFSAESLREHHPGVISALHRGLQCATCGMRFKEIQSEHYSRHLDWHFRMNRREKDGAKKAISRRWNYELEDWIQFEEFEDFEERIPSFFELESDNQQAEVPDVPVVISVPATSNDEEACPVCSERFQLFWVEDEEEWHFRDAVRHDDITYHPACYEDHKKAAEAEKNIKVEEKSAEEETVAESESITESEKVDESVEKFIKHEVEEDDIVSLLHSLLHDVCENVEIEISKVDKAEVPSKTQIEEEILEGKPGEEEIIGVISESDMDIESDIPKIEAKMVVMQSGGITLKVKAESLQCHSPSNPSEKDSKPEEEKPVDDDEIIFRPPTPDPSFDVMPPVSRGRELSGLCCIM